MFDVLIIANKENQAFNNTLSNEFCGEMWHMVDKTARIYDFAGQSNVIMYSVLVQHILFMFVKLVLK